MYAVHEISTIRTGHNICARLTVSRCVIQVEVCLLDTLTMISLGIAQTKQSFLQELILLVPEGKGNVLQAMAVRNTGNTVLAPSVCSGSCLVMREVTPSVSVVRVVFADCRPLSFRNIWPPFFPVFCPLAVFFQTLLFLAEVFVVVDDNHSGQARR